MTNEGKKYLYPVEMDKDYAKQVGIDPSELTFAMLDGKWRSVYLVEIEDEQLYHELMRPIWKAEKALQRSKRCMISNGDGQLVRCEGNCSVCPLERSGAPISFEAMEETGGFRNTNDGVHRQMDSATYTESTAEIVEDAMMLEALWSHIGELSEENQIILTMFSEGASEREIAEAVGLSQKGVNKRKKALFELLRENLKDFL